MRVKNMSKKQGKVKMIQNPLIRLQNNSTSLKCEQKNILLRLC